MYLDFQTFKKDYLNLNDFKIVEDDNLFYLWKLSDIPSSFGNKKSVLDLLEENYFSKKFTLNQKNNFNKEQEYGLLNRLDNATSGFLYFAKTPEIYEKFKKLQKNEKIKKIYYTKVKGGIGGFNNDYVGLQNKGFEIKIPIMHKNKTKMIVIKSEKDIKKGRGKQHFVKTFVEAIEYDKKENTTWLKVIITKGIRHQIRVHLASIGFPIIGDNLYGEKKADRLYLFSVGTDLNL